MSVFGVTPGRIAQIAADWRTAGTSVADVRLTPPGEQLACRLTAAAAEFCEGASSAAAADATRLLALADALARFDAETAQSDRSAAAAIGSAASGGPR